MVVAPGPPARYENPVPAKGFRSALRLLFDENVSPAVAVALSALGVTSFAIGAGDAPGKGSTDPEVITWATSRNCVIITFNHDMMLMADEAGAKFVWLDHRNRSMSRFEQARLALSQVEAWQQLFTDHPDCCVHAGRTFCEALDAREAARRVEQRFSARKRTQAARGRRTVGSAPPLPMDL